MWFVNVYSNGLMRKRQKLVVRLGSFHIHRIGMVCQHFALEALYMEKILQL